MTPLGFWGGFQNTLTDDEVRFLYHKFLGGSPGAEKCKHLLSVQKNKRLFCFCSTNVSGRDFMAKILSFCWSLMELSLSFGNAKGCYYNNICPDTLCFPFCFMIWKGAQ